MAWPSRHREVFVELADTLVDHFEIADFTYRLCERCVEILDVAAAGLLLADPDGELVYLASSSERSHLIELFQTQNREGPSHDCYQSGQPVVALDLLDNFARWPLFSPRALELGFGGAAAVPMRLHGSVIGAINLFTTAAGHDIDLSMAQAMADIATIGIVNERRLTRASELADQLQAALDSRVLIEQAKGVVAERGGLNVDDAFTLIRNHSRRTNQPIGQVASDVVARTISIEDMQTP